MDEFRNLLDRRRSWRTELENLMELLNELYTILEKVTPGLDMGGFLLDTKKGTIITKIGGKSYEFTPKEKDAAELHKSVVGVAKHSQGRALAYLKQHATGIPL